MIKRIFLWLFLLSVWVSCRQPEREARLSTDEKYAVDFSIRKAGKFRIVTVKHPFPGGKPAKYVLVPRNSRPLLPDSLKRYPVIRIPVKRIVPTSVTHLIYFLALKTQNDIVGFPRTYYIRLPWYRRAVEEGKIKDLGSELRLNPESVISVKPDVVFVFSTGDDQKNFDVLRRVGIPVVFVSEWMERHPLGRAEWIKFFGAFVDKDSLAERIFRRIEGHYKEIAVKTGRKSRRPKVIQASVFRDKWFFAGGESWAATIITDAGGKFLPENDMHTSSIPLSAEQAMMLLKKADFWINSGGPLPEKYRSPRFFRGTIIPLTELPFNRADTVSFFEYSPLYPDVILERLHRIFSNNRMQDASQ